MRYKIIMAMVFIIPLLYTASSRSDEKHLFPGGSYVKQPIEMPEPVESYSPAYQDLLLEKNNNKGSEYHIDKPQQITDKKSLHKSQSSKTDTEDNSKVIKEIRFKKSAKDEESVLFVLEGNHTPDTFSLEGDRPRVVCDFPDTHIGENIASQIETKGKIIRQIRFGYYDDSEPRLRVVLDLVPDKSKDYEIQPVFFDDINIYAIVVR